MSRGMAATDRPPPAGGRILSIDLFRALTILTMVFVNEVARYKGIPAWMNHAPEGSNTMTFVDVVFPAFLFIVGMAIPLATERRRRRGEGAPRIVGHVLRRVAGLLALGVLMVNMPALSAAHVPVPPPAWRLLVYVGAILAWNAGPLGRGRAWGRLLRLGGVALLIGMAAIYRREAGGQVAWLRTEWWGILGLIGWAYLVCSLLYLALRDNAAALAGALALLIALYIGDETGALHRLGPVRDYVSLGRFLGGHSAIALAGVLATLLVLAPARAPASKIGALLLLALALAVAGYLLSPLYGISKVNATPAWCLYSAALCCAAYALVYAVVDVANWRAPATVLQAVGANALLAFLLPGVVDAALDLCGLEIHGFANAGAAAIARAAVFSALIAAATALLTRAGVRLAL